MTPSVPSSVAEGLIRLMAVRTGRTPTLTASRRVRGGCINSAAYVDTDAGDRVFVKWNAEVPADFFEREAEGLRALEARGSLRVPEVLGWSPTEAAEPAWLALEYVASERARPEFDEALGAGLADLHAPSGPSPGFGWSTNNYIGSLEQLNGWTPDWAGFWRDRRLAPQLEAASPHFGSQDLSDFRSLLEGLDRLLDPGRAEGPSLLHGDLWSGNVYADAEGRPVLIDPAVYAGHREVDLAMSELFGGFGPAFYEAYGDAMPLTDGYARSRRSVYQLYPLLVHVNLFGHGYVGSARRALHSALRAL